MKIAQLTVVFLFLFLHGNVISKNYDKINIEFLKVGWGDEGYVRNGYFAPVYANLKTSTSFSGFFSLVMDNLCFSRFFITKNSLQNKDFSSEIYFFAPIFATPNKLNIKITEKSVFAKSLKHDFLNNLTEILYEFSVDVKHVKKDEFLIAVEKPYKELWQREFAIRYPDAVTKSKFVAFSLDELSTNPSAYEALDLIVLSSANLSVDIQKALSEWSNSMNGVVLYKISDIGNIPSLFSGRNKSFHLNPSVNENLYMLKQHKKSLIIKNILLHYLIVFIVIILGIFFTVLFLRNTVSIVLLIIGIITLLLIALYAFFLPSEGIIIGRIDRPLSSPIQRYKHELCINKNYTEYLTIINCSTKRIFECSFFQANKDLEKIIYTGLPDAKDKIAYAGIKNVLIRPIFKDLYTIEKTRIHFILDEIYVLSIVASNEGVSQNLEDRALICEINYCKE